MIVTIDGPAGAGKSTVARLLAERLGFRYLDTGAMYRAAALAGLRAGVDWDNPQQLVELVKARQISIRNNRILLDGEDVTEQVRSPEVTRVTKYAADNPEIRLHLVQLQRQLAAEGNIVTEGRDQGSFVFPHAQCKIFLTASPEERARRRLREFADKGIQLDYEQVLREIQERDARDSQRAVGPLVRPPDAIEVCTDGLGIDQVVNLLEKIVREKLSQCTSI